jgi:uncharacterized protein (DUF2249 family)
MFVHGMRRCVGANIIGKTVIYDTTKISSMSTEPTADGTQELDVRTIDGEPFSNIIAALDDLNEDETLVLVNSFEPEPLYAVLEQRGFVYETTRAGDDEWRVSITHA